MKIGIGITSYKRPEHLELCLRQIGKHTGHGKTDLVFHNNIGMCIQAFVKDENTYTVFVAKDIPNIAKAKNECLYNLRDCDHIFLFDDDVWPIKDGWVEFFTQNEKYGIEHLLYLNERHNLVSEHVEGGYWLEYYKDCGGCFMWLTKNVLKDIGYLNSEYKQYGFEHAAYSIRASYKRHLAKIPTLKFEGYESSKGSEEYLYSLDYQGEGGWGVKHRQSIADYKVLKESIDYNRKVFEKEINGDKIYYEYNK